MHNQKTSSSHNLHTAASSQQTTESSLPEVTEFTGVNEITHLHKRSQDKIFITAVHNLINSINSGFSFSRHWLEAVELNNGDAGQWHSKAISPSVCQVQKCQTFLPAGNGHLKKLLHCNKQGQLKLSKSLSLLTSPLHF